MRELIERALGQPLDRGEEIAAVEHESGVVLCPFGDVHVRRDHDESRIQIISTEWIACDDTVALEEVA